MLISWTGTWKQTVGAQWLVVHGPNAPALVSLVQAANTLPMMLLALPGGVLADSFDRRWLLLTVQAYFFVAGTLLAVLTAAGQMPPALLLLPVIASRRLGQGADGYGALFGALGAGAIVGALVLGRVRAGLSTNGMLVAAGVVYGAAMAVIILVPSFLAALAILVVAGLAWMAATSTLDAELQLVLPVWVRARGLSIYTVTFQGSQAAGALIWGLVANQVGLQPAILVAAVVLLAGVIAGMVWRIPETGHLDPEPATPYWTDPRLAFDPEPAAGPVIVALEFTVEPEREAAFLEAMDQLRGTRLRTGATPWELYRDAEQPNRFVEMFSVPSWEEHMRQHHGRRLTGTDREIEEAALAFRIRSVPAQHLLPP